MYHWSINSIWHRKKIDSDRCFCLKGRSDKVLKKYTWCLCTSCKDEENMLHFVQDDKPRVILSLLCEDSCLWCLTDKILHFVQGTGIYEIASSLRSYSVRKQSQRRRKDSLLRSGWQKESVILSLVCKASFFWFLTDKIPHFVQSRMPYLRLLRRCAPRKDKYKILHFVQDDTV